MKRLSYILLAAMLVAVLAVSCTAEVIDDSLVAMVRFTDNVGSRALEVSREDVSVGELYWKYDAAKVSGPASGAVTGKYLGQGLSKEAGPFSLGDWNFTLYGYKDKEYKTLMYKGTGTGTVEKGKTNAIRISVEPQMTQEGTGSLHISKSIQLTKDGVVVKGSDGSTTYTATSVVVTRLSDGSKANVNADDSYFWKADGITSDSYKVVVAFVDAATGITHAENTVYVNVFDGLTTVISGTLDEVTSSISFDADVKEGRISETKTVTPDTETGNVSASFGFSPVSNESSTGNDVLGTTIEGAFTGSGSIELNVYGSEGASRKFAVENENSVVSAGFDINLSEGLAVAENGSVTITTYIQPGLTGEVNVVYRDEDGNDPTEGQPTGVSYEVETGKLVFTTTHFSEYYVVSDSVAENTTTGKKRYATLQEAIDNAKAGDTIQLSKDIVLEDTVVVDKKLTLDLDKKTISNISYLWEDNSIDWSLVSVRGNGNLTITGDGTLNAKENDCFALDVQNGATLTIENGTFVSNVHAVYVLEGSAYINGGEYSVQQKYSDASKADEFVLNCYDPNYQGKDLGDRKYTGRARIVVTGGKFKNFNPADCYAEGAHTNFVAEGYAAEYDENLSVWTVKKAVAEVDGFYFASLEAAFEKALALENPVMTILDDIDLSGKNWIPIKIGSENNAVKSLTIEGNGHSIKNMTIAIAADNDPKGAPQAGSSNYYGEGFIAEVYTKTLTIRNLTFNSANVNDSGMDETPAHHTSGVSVVVGRNCYSTVNLENVNVIDSKVYGGEKVGALIGHCMGGKTDIDGGSVKNTTVTCTWYYSAMLIGFANDKAKITVNEAVLESNSNTYDLKWSDVTAFDTTTEGDTIAWEPYGNPGLWVYAAWQDQIAMTGGTEESTHDNGTYKGKINGHALSFTKVGTAYSGDWTTL